MATSGREWADRTKRLAARVPDLDIFSQGLVERISGGWQITTKGRAVLEFMEARPAAPAPVQTPLLEAAAVIAPSSHIPSFRQPADRANRRQERRERRREARERARANASGEIEGEKRAQTKSGGSGSCGLLTSPEPEAHLTLRRPTSKPRLKGSGPTTPD